MLGDALALRSDRAQDLVRDTILDLWVKVLLSSPRQ